MHGVRCAPTRLRAAALVLGAGVLAACGPNDPEAQLERREAQIAEEFDVSDESIFDLFRTRTGAEQGVAVNRFLWQASLDTLSFLPLEGADPFAGLIVTGWGRVGGDGAPYRVTVYISEPALDARALNVAGFRQQGGRAVPVSDAANRQLEDAILTRARQLRIAAADRG